MNELPEFWRVEIWHPLSIHFPLALLLFGTVFYLIGFGLKKRFLENMAKVLVLLGTLSAWLSVYTGNIADAEVVREICDPTVLEIHEQNAYVVATLFSIASLLIVTEYYGFMRKLTRYVRFFIAVFLLVGSGFLSYTGHLGATLVYQQSAGVYTPSEDCDEFTD